MQDSILRAMEEISTLEGNVQRSDDFLQRVATIIHRCLNAHAVLIFIVDQTAQLAVCHAGTGEFSDANRRERVKFWIKTGSPAGYSILFGKTEFYNRDRLYTDFPLHMRIFAMLSLVITPLWDGTNTFGSIEVQFLDADPGCDTQDLHTMQRLAFQISSMYRSLLP